jgi:hypothetical protein
MAGRALRSAAVTRDCALTLATLLGAVAIEVGSAGPARCEETARLTLLLVVDQLPRDRIDADLPGGLGRLVREGRVYTEAALDGQPLFE